MDTPPAGALDRIREEIDAIDDAMLALLAKRFAAVEEVKRIKAASGAIAQSPIRPAREAAILRRLVLAKPDSGSGRTQGEALAGHHLGIDPDAGPGPDPCRHGAF